MVKVQQAEEVQEALLAALSHRAPFMSQHTTATASGYGASLGVGGTATSPGAMGLSHRSSGGGGGRGGPPAGGTVPSLRFNPRLQRSVKTFTNGPVR